MELIKCFVSVFNAIVVLLMAFPMWEGVKVKDNPSVVGFGSLILLYVANTMLIWWR